MPRNVDLYLAVIPLVHLGMPSYGLTEQVMTVDE
jgi:hypothetical protein